MGHVTERLRGTGSNEREAQSDAIETFLYEHGHRYSFRDVEKSTLIEKVPPKKQVETPRGRNIYITSEPDPTAPQDQWLEVWEFDIRFHV